MRLPATFLYFFGILINILAVNPINAQLTISEPIIATTYPTSQGSNILIKNEAKSITFTLYNDSGAAITRAAKLFIEENNTGNYGNLVWEKVFTLAAWDTMQVSIGGDCADVTRSPAGDYTLSLRADATTHLPDIHIGSPKVPCVIGGVSCADVSLQIFSSGNVTGCDDTPPNYSASHYDPIYTDCNFSDADCLPYSGLYYGGGVIKMTVTGIYGNLIKLRVQKCDFSSFVNNGLFHLKAAICDSAHINYTSSPFYFSTGDGVVDATIELNVPLSSATIYCAMESGTAPIRLYSRPIIITPIAVSSHSAMLSATNFDVHVFPNPVEEQLQIVLSHSTPYQPVHYTIRDALGREVKQMNTTSPLANYHLSVGELVSGVYSLQVRQGKHFRVLWFVKK